MGNREGARAAGEKLELVFTDSGAGALKMAKGPRTIGSAQSIGFLFNTDADEAEVARLNEKAKKLVLPPYEGPWLEGTSNEVVAILTLLDMGDIAPGRLWPGREALWRDMGHRFLRTPEERDEYAQWADGQLEKVQAELARLQNARQVRIWWSDAPGDACGYHWAVDFLQGCDCEIISVKCPTYWQHRFSITEEAELEVPGGAYRVGGMGGVEPEGYPAIAEACGRALPDWEREIIAREWQALAKQNAPLRAVVNGKLLGVPEDFYDGFLRAAIPEGGAFTEGEVLGRAIGKGPDGVGDVWYGRRLAGLLQSGELVLVERAGPGGHPYGDILRRG